MAVLYFSAFLCLLGLHLAFANESTEDHPPFFVETPPSLVLFKENESVDLRYSTANNTASTFKWKKNGVNLDLNAPNIRQDSNTIRISPATYLDEGFYQCITENKYGATVSNVTQLQMAVLEPVGLRHQTNPLEAVEGQPFVIPASTFNVIPRSGSVEQYVWMRYAGDLDAVPQRIVPDKRINIGQNGDLHFAFVNSSDDLGGKLLYVDAIFHPFLNLTIEGNYTKLIVKSNPNVTQQFAPKLSFSSEPESIAIEGENITMRCFFSGKEEPEIDWILQHGSRELGRRIVSDDKTGLTIVSVTASDEMSYYCMGGNNLGSSTYEISLKIEAIPRFLKEEEDSPQNMNVLAKEDAVFHCNSYAKPEANVVWFYNGKSLTENPRKRFAISADQKTLTISSVCLECQDPDGRSNVSDSGVIQCNASNIHGYALGTGYLNVISLQSGGVVESTAAAQENSIPFEVAFVVIFTISMLLSF